MVFLLHYQFVSSAAGSRGPHWKGNTELLHTRHHVANPWTAINPANKVWDVDEFWWLGFIVVHWSSKLVIRLAVLKEIT